MEELRQVIRLTKSATFAIIGLLAVAYPEQVDSNKAIILGILLLLAAVLFATEPVKQEK